MLEKESKTKRYKITKRLKKPYELVDEFHKRPTTEDCMNTFIDALTQHALDDDLARAISELSKYAHNMHKCDRSKNRFLMNGERRE